MANTKLMYGVEHMYSDGRQTYEIFPTLKEAEEYVGNCKNWSAHHFPLFIFKAGFNTEAIFIEDGFWNYEEFSDTIINNYSILKEFNFNYL